MVSDPIADLLTRIRNAAQARHRYVDMPWSKMKQRMAEILKEEGFIEGFLTRDQGSAKQMRLFLKYGPGRCPVVRGLKRKSRPGCRKYVNKDQIPRVQGGIGICIVSTSSGVMTGKKAYQQGVGGELLCEVW